MTEAFGMYAEFYDALNGQKTYETEALYIKRLIDFHCETPGRDIIEFGAGTGKLARLLSRLGCNITATDLSPAMASKSVSEVEVSVADIRTFSADRKFDVALAYFHVLSYLTTDRDISSAFSNVSNTLETGGIFIADFWFDEAVETEGPVTRIRRVTTDEVEVTRIAEPEWHPNQRRVDVKYTFFARTNKTDCFSSFEETHKMRYFSREEIKYFAESVGLDLIAFEESITGHRPGPSAWGVTAVIRKST